MQEARSKIKLEELGIFHLRPRIAATGAVIIEVLGEVSLEKLAERLRSVISDSKARITRPVKKAEIRIMGLDEFVSKEELAVAIGNIGGYHPGDCKIGDIRRNSMRLGTA